MKPLNFDAQGLIPVITQCYLTKDVLMLAYMNEEAFNKTLTEKVAYYYSRSRKSLWKKGETSGHYQYVKSMYYDCDQDALLLLVDQRGVACHTLNRSCFFESIFQEQDTPNKTSVFQEVYATIEDRKKHPKEGSYTTYLFTKGLDKILKKVGEESAEVIIGAKNQNPAELTSELSDLAYHAMVLMVEQGITIDAIKAELKKRQLKP